MFSTTLMGQNKDMFDFLLDVQITTKASINLTSYQLSKNESHRFKLNS